MTIPAALLCNDTAHDVALREDADHLTVLGNHDSSDATLVHEIGCTEYGFRGGHRYDFPAFAAKDGFHGSQR